MSKEPLSCSQQYLQALGFVQGLFMLRQASNQVSSLLSIFFGEGWQWVLTGDTTARWPATVVSYLLLCYIPISEVCPIKAWFMATGLLRLKSKRKTALCLPLKEHHMQLACCDVPEKPCKTQNSQQTFTLLHQSRLTDNLGDKNLILFYVVKTQP